MAKAAAPLAPPPPTISDGTRESLDAGSDAMELVRVFERMRTLMAQAEEKLKKDRIQIKKERIELEEERQSLVADIAEQRRLLADEAATTKREAESDRKALEAERRALESDRQSFELERKSPAVNSNPAAPTPKRLASESAPALRTKAAPVARTKEPPVTHGSVSSAVPPAKPKPMATPVSTPAKVEVPASRETQIEDDPLSDNLLIKHEETDEADRLAREDDVESKQKPARPPPEPPTYWRHVKPPEKKAIAPSPTQKEEEVKEVLTEAKGNDNETAETKLTEVPRKANPAYKANGARYKPPPVTPPSCATSEALETQAERKDESKDAAREDSEVESSPAKASVPARVKAPPTRCPPQIPPQASSTQESSPAPPEDSATLVPKSKVKAAPAPAKAKVKAPPGY
mmetsp:Transcript_65312/g.103485  ORF Transcript_65312/g.103485 Transcript_65312/m.103485 type:complete len:404 (+) Transcript_65312:56-1267(+)